VKNPFNLPKTTTDKNLGLGETVNVQIKGRVVLLDRAQLGNALGYDLDGEDAKLIKNSLVSTWERGNVLLLESVEKI